jgi:hypothetical protein
MDTGQAVINAIHTHLLRRQTQHEQTLANYRQSYGNNEFDLAWKMYSSSEIKVHEVLLDEIREVLDVLEDLEKDK